MICPRRQAQIILQKVDTSTFSVEHGKTSPPHTDHAKHNQSSVFDLCRQVQLILYRISMDEILMHKSKFSKPIEVKGPVKRKYKSNNFKCTVPHCYATSAQKSTMTFHLKQHKSKPYQCSKCPRKFRTKDLHDHHFKVKHSATSKPFECRMCGKCFSHPNGLKYHVMVSHTKENDRTCSICNLGFKGYQRLKTHQRRDHSIGKMYKCSNCEKEYSNAGLYAHVSKKHTKEPIRSYYPTKMAECQFCHKFYKSNLALEKHVLIHSGDKPFACDLCPYKANQEGNLKAHQQRIHLKLKPHKCLDCDKAFLYQCHLKQHMRIHTGEKPYPCTQCTKKFRHSASLKTHTSWHKGERNFPCNLCGKAFTQSGHLCIHIKYTHLKETSYKYKCDYENCRFKCVSNYELERHTRVHTGEKHLSCKFCGEKFRCNSGLRKHETSHVKSFDCETCAKSYPTKASLATHLKLVHVKEVRFNCGFCDKSFYCSSSFGSHLRAHTMERPCKCEKCGYAFRTISHLKRHKERTTNCVG